MVERRAETPGADLEALRSGAERDLGAWRQLWESDREFPIASHRGWLGRAIVAAKRLLRPLVRAPQADLWERQRAYNLVLQDHAETAARLPAVERALAARIEEVGHDLEARIAGLGSELQSVQGELVRDIGLARDTQERELGAAIDQLRLEIREASRELMRFLRSHADRLDVLEGFHNEGYQEVMEHTAALFSRLDQKLDRYRDLSRDRWSRLGALAEIADRQGAAQLTRAVREQGYVEFERLFRGTESDIGARLAPYLEILRGRGTVLDLGCGRGEALAELEREGIRARGVDASSQMVARCREKGLVAEEGDLLAALEAEPEAELGGVVAFHVVEHLPPGALERLVRSAWRALADGGVLALETPSPLSLVVGARNFWIDPTHVRPVHPESLEALFRAAGFDPVERLDLQPFAPEERLPDLALDMLPAELQPFGERLLAQRDHLDRLLYGWQDFGMVGYKRGGGAAGGRAGGGRR